jgi:alkylation response protein AidB-like acyl-CoA dehydrogenase
MHLAALVMMADAYRALASKGRAEAAARLAAALRGVVVDKHVITVLGTEPGAHIGHFQTRARGSDGGFVIDGLKVFGTLAQAATHLNVGVCLEGPDGKRFAGFALLPAGPRAYASTTTGMRSACAPARGEEQAQAAEHARERGALRSPAARGRDRRTAARRARGVRARLPAHR